MTTMPGYAADVAVYRSCGHYPAAPRGGASVVSRIVPMYKSAAGLLDAGCIPNCVCVTAEGCPCCDSGSVVETSEAHAQRVTATCDPGAGVLLTFHG